MGLDWIGLDWTERPSTYTSARREEYTSVAQHTRRAMHNLRLQCAADVHSEALEGLV